METVGIISDPLANSDAEAESIERLIAHYGFDVIFVGPNVDMNSDIMLRLLAMDGLTIHGAIEDAEPRKLRQEKNSWAGPRNRWGSLK